MSDKASGKNFFGSKGIFWFTLSLCMVIIVIYNLYTGGLRVHDVQVGEEGLNVKFQGDAQTAGISPASNPGVVDQSRLAEISQKELELKKRELDLKIQELENRLKASSTVTSLDDGVPVTRSKYNLTGLWISDEGVKYQIHQNGSQLTMQEMNPLFGVTAVAEGSIDNNQIDMQYTSMLGTTGSGRLKITTNGNRLQGVLNDHAIGAQIPLTLSR